MKTHIKDYCYENHYALSRIKEWMIDDKGRIKVRYECY
jgi:hypothetical protein